jgi:hypothetical protein
MCKFLTISFLLLWTLGTVNPVVAYSAYVFQDEDAKRPSKSSKTEAKESTGTPSKRAAERRAPGKVREPLNVVKRETRPAPAEITINVTPADSTVRFNGVEHSVENGTFRRGELKPGTYKIVVRRDGYREKEHELSVGAGERKPLNVRLELESGILSVVPTTTDATISIIKAETNREVGRYDGRANNVELPPGRYQVVISKNGHRTTVRDVTVEDASTIYLEPPLELLPPPPTPTPRRTERRSFRADAATQMQAVPEGKYIVINLSGRSGNTTSPVGAVDVTLNADYSRTGSGSVVGMLTGFPCQVDFVRLENVAEYSFIEPPGTSNQWGRVVVRVRPKDSKRAMHFLINWKLLQGAPVGATP